MNNIKNNKGMTLIELMISIVVASVVITMLLSILMMGLKAKATLDVEAKMSTESTIIAEKIRFNVFLLQAQSIQLISNTTTETTIHISHTYDIVINPLSHVIEKDFSNPIIDILIFDKTNGQITYNGELLHDSNVFIDIGSSIDLITMNGDLASFGTAYDDGVIQLTLYITVNFDNGAVLVPRKYVTTIII